MSLFARVWPGTSRRDARDGRRDAARAPARPRARSQFNLRGRLLLVCGTLALCSVALLARALDLQVIDKAFYQQQGAARFLREIPASLIREVRPRASVSRPVKRISVPLAPSLCSKSALATILLWTLTYLPHHGKQIPPLLALAQRASMVGGWKTRLSCRLPTMSTALRCMIWTGR